MGDKTEKETHLNFHLNAHTFPFDPFFRVFFP